MPIPSKKTDAQKWVEVAKKESDLTRAKHYFNMALQVDPDNIIALNGKGIICHQLGECADAIACYDSILAKGITNKAPIYYNKSAALKALHKYEAAFNFVKKSLFYDSSNERAQRLKRKLEKIMAEKKIEETRKLAKEKAGNNFDQAVYTRWDPPAPSTLLNRAYFNDWRDYKYSKGFGEDIVKEKAIAEKINKHIYCCEVCYHQSKNECRHKRAKVSPKAICKHFKPKKGI